MVIPILVLEKLLLYISNAALYYALPSFPSSCVLLFLFRERGEIFEKCCYIFPIFPCTCTDYINLL